MIKGKSFTIFFSPIIPLLVSLFCAELVNTDESKTPIPTASTTTPIVSINDTIQLQGTANDLYGSIVKWEWDAGNTGTFIETTPDSSYTTFAPSTANSTYPCILRVTDDDGNIAADTVSIIVLLDAPNTTASTTTPLVSINDTLRYLGTATDAYGTIVTWEWDAGNTGTFIETTPDSSYITLAPSVANSSYPCILRVTDDDGNVAADTVSITVLLDAPNTTASTTTPIVSINDTIQLQGTASDLYGSIEKWEWDAGTGTFIETTPDSSYTTTAPSTADSSFQCILRVTDNDGNSAADTVHVNVLLDAPIPTASITSIVANDTIRLQGTAIDAYGIIEKWEWDAGNTGSFIETTPDSGYTTIVPSTVDSSFQCVLKVTDDDGNVAADTVTMQKVTDIDGNTYSAITIGTQTWTIENYRCLRLNDGDTIPVTTDNTDWGFLSIPGCCYYRNSWAQGQIYGVLYNWYAVNTGKLAPAGWHVATDAEWDTLQNYLIANGYNYDGTTTGNKIAKSLASKNNWESSTNDGAIGNDSTKNNSSCFSALPGGYRHIDGGFVTEASFGFWWTATEKDVSTAYCSLLCKDNPNLLRSYRSINTGMSVRLVKDKIYPEL